MTMLVSAIGLLVSFVVIAAGVAGALIGYDKWHHPRGSRRTGLSREQVAELRASVALRGAGHECSEWLDPNNYCALCGKRAR